MKVRVLSTVYWANWLEKMAKTDVYLGIDTSCYTTSVALLDTKGCLVGETRRILKVKEGKCGLQQSEMVFQHTRNLPDLMESVFNEDYNIIGIGVSEKPRPLADSYMPAFMTGLGLARSLAAVHRVTVWKNSHQENHLEAARWSAQGPYTGRFLFLHASGGTTDLLLCEKGEDGKVSLTEIGGSIDLHAGQFIDRVGVALGCGFPAGPAVEKLAQGATEVLDLPVSVNKCKVSFSGPSTAVLRKIEAGANPSTAAAGAQMVLATTFFRMLRNAVKEYKVKDVLLAGGVSSNGFIREFLKDRLSKHHVKLWIPEGRFSCDNALGNAVIAWQNGEKIER